MKITHVPGPATTKMCSVPGGQCAKSQARSRRCSPLDHEQAFAGEDEQVLQTGLGPLHAGVRDPAWSIRRDSRSEGAASAQRTA